MSLDWKYIGSKDVIGRTQCCRSSPPLQLVGGLSDTGGGASHRGTPQDQLANEDEEVHTGATRSWVGVRWCVQSRGSMETRSSRCHLLELSTFGLLCRVHGFHVGWFFLQEAVVRVEICFRLFPRIGKVRQDLHKVIFKVKVPIC